MDQMTGLEAVAKIRAAEKGTGRHIPVIGLTSLVGNNLVWAFIFIFVGNCLVG